MSDFIGTKLTMNLGERSYDIIVKRGSLENLYQFARLDRRVAVVTDSGVPAQYAQMVADQCKDATIITVPQGEASKSFKILETVLRQMLDFGMGRGDLVVAVGGGVVGDLAGFAASIYMRGIDFINCPTTTLSMSEIFERNILASGVIPQISAIMGPSAGGAVYSPALTDFIIMKEQTSYMFLTGPKVVKTVTGEDIDAEHLGGASVHATKSGVTHFAAKTEEEAIEMIKSLLSYIPSNNTEEAPRIECTDPIDRMDDTLNEIIPEDPNQAYDMYKVIGAVTDNGEFFEVQPKFAKNIITGFARFNGQSVGIVANQPAAYAGVLDVNASRKAARFVRFCDAFNIPIVSLVDVPGFLPGTGQEYNAVILHGAQLLYAYGEATVPKITITLRKSYGGSHIVMGCKQLRADLNFAWPSSEIAVMGASGAVAVLCGKEAKAKKEAGEDVKAFLAEKEQEYTDKFANPYQAAQYGYIDDVIEPRNTRFRICRGLAQLATKRQSLPAKKHGCMPM